MNRDQKAAVVDEIAGQLKGAAAIFAVDYRGLSVTHAAELRARLRDAETNFRIVKNSLTERATDQAGADALKAMLEGPTALFSKMRLSAYRLDCLGVGVILICDPKPAG